MSKKQHLSRLAAPKSWPIRRKGIKWIAKPTAGPHAMNKSLPLIIILRDMLKVARTSKEANFIVKNKEVLINSLPVRDIKLGIGFFDTISLPKLKNYYRLGLGKNGKFKLVEIPEKEAHLIPIKVANKISLKKNKTQINFSNGWNLLSKEKLKPGDSVLFNTITKKIEQKFPLTKGTSAYITSGKHSGVVSIIKDIKSIGEFKKQKIVTLSLSKTEDIATDLSHIFVVGGAKSAIKVE